MPGEVESIMATFGLSNTAISNLSNTVVDTTVSSMNTDAASGMKETTWQNTKWSKYLGYFMTIPELKSALIMKALWIVGKGYTCDADAKVTTDHVRGWGKDSFKDILYNQYLTARLAGDSFAEIITDKKGDLLNLKPLDPGSIKTIVDEKGLIIRYEQTAKAPGKDSTKFEPDKIFHLSHNRIADQIHGISDIESLQETIDAENENFKDLKKIMHRQARPMIMFKLGTDDPAKIEAFKNKMDQAVSKGENIYIPFDKDTVEYEVIQVNISESIMAWRDDIRNKFYRTLGLPLIIFGNGGSSESGGKIEYLGHEQVFSSEQLWLEEQIWKQLRLRIKLNSPVTLLENLQTDQRKDANQGMEIQRNDVTAGSGE
jgi:hypothetical protein